VPAEIRRLADSSYSILKTDSSHPSLHLKKTGSLWSVRVGLHYRALATEVEGDLVWFWLGSHADYDRLVGRRPTGKAQQSKGRRGRKARTS
jgi:hypothetical protein